MKKNGVMMVHFSPTPVENLGVMIDKCIDDTPDLESHQSHDGGWVLTRPNGDGKRQATISLVKADERPTHLLKGDTRIIELFIEFARSNIRIVPRHEDRINLYLNIER